MVRVRVRTASSCFRVSRARSPPLQSSLSYDSIKFASQKSACGENDSGSSFSTDTPGSSDDSFTQSESKVANRIMVVVDSSQEAKGALQWAVSHTVQKEDTVILLHIAKPSKSGSSVHGGGVNSKVNELLYSMKSICEAKRPGVQVEVVALTAEEKGPVIVDQAKKQKATLLVLGHRRRSVAWRFFMRWFGRKRSNQSIVDYCIQNAGCMTVAVRRKNRRLGGYLITTKRHKNFWLLA